MNANNKQTACGRGQKSRIPKPTAASGRMDSELMGAIETEPDRFPKSVPPMSCEFIPELPFPWNGAFLEWQKELRNQTGHRMSGDE